MRSGRRRQMQKVVVMSGGIAKQGRERRYERANQRESDGPSKFLGRLGESLIAAGKERTLTRRETKGRQFQRYASSLPRKLELLAISRLLLLENYHSLLHRAVHLQLFQNRLIGNTRFPGGPCLSVRLLPRESQMLEHHFRRCQGVTRRMTRQNMKELINRRLTMKRHTRIHLLLLSYLHIQIHLLLQLHQRVLLVRRLQSCRMHHEHLLLRQDQHHPHPDFLL
jgi:hypothetical protein